MKRGHLILVFFAALLAALPVLARGQEQTGEPSKVQWDSAPRIPDTPVIDQHGHELKFYRDLVKGKTVAINFIFTNCLAACPMLTAIFGKAQQDLAEQAGGDVYFISISVDPVNDRPENLKEYAARFEAGPGWTFVTGKKPEIDRLVKALGAYGSNKSDHSPAVLVGNDNSNRWTRIYALSGEAPLVKIIREIQQ